MVPHPNLRLADRRVNANVWGPIIAAGVTVMVVGGFITWLVSTDRRENDIEETRVKHAAAWWAERLTGMTSSTVGVRHGGTGAPSIEEEYQHALIYTYRLAGPLRYVAVCACRAEFEHEHNETGALRKWIEHSYEAAR